MPVRFVYKYNSNKKIITIEKTHIKIEKTNNNKNLVIQRDDMCRVRMPLSVFLQQCIESV